ncbi:hypothetical protein SKAU_G00372540 [Synaphobranchus kaupii]|uniref:Liver-expressed antimicrobial peptide 2 n=1 Tax=Synaphobranchus kaupii TaxID=118154 RepID=A0A9Q1EGC6_SYNKA|nr:hypothetical protein SKAU_G00372540 [Synaphobranchus kaupii]
MQEQISTRSRAAWGLVLLVFIHQVHTHPVPDSASSHLQKGGLLRRIARMTPLWRIMGSKPLRAYCKNNYECSTGICSGGHCSFIQAIKS